MNNMLYYLNHEVKLLIILTIRLERFITQLIKQYRGIIIFICLMNNMFYYMAILIKITNILKDYILRLVTFNKLEL